MTEKYPIEDWRYEVANDDTNLGYKDWVAHQMEANNETPETECDKMLAARDKSQVIGEFLDWLLQQGVVLARYYEESRLSAMRVNIEELLAEYFEIDLDKVETEKRAMLDDLRKKAEGQCPR